MKKPFPIMLLIFAQALLMTYSAGRARAQDAPAPGFVLSLKNGSTIRGRVLSRDEASGTLRLTMTETSSGAPRSYAVVAMDDAQAIKASATESDSILIRLVGGSELKCKEFNLNGDTISVKIGTASTIELHWEQIQSISFGS
ncbi:MAG TPA: hypothetical protein VNH22_18100 [Blastocatellia bacterium]|jgi:hypothetical protein|nr:hypothetical protein [Blastocatellia bacterium]